MRFIVGVDEVGRGPLAGPVTVGAVAFLAKYKTDTNVFLRGIKDSKKLSQKQRCEWIRAINERRTSIWCAVASVESKTIDNIGISRATMRAVGMCLRRLEVRLPIGSRVSNFNILLDGNLYAPRTYINQRTIIRGDEKIPIISAASIIAKVHRDNIMRRYHRIFPEYRFDLHKGYGTRLHNKNIMQHGFCTIHRKTFCKNI